MKKLLIMASLFWPQKKSGGPPISLYNLVNGIKDQLEIYVVSKNHEIGEVDPLPGIESGWNRFEFGQVFYTEYGHHTRQEIMRLLEEVGPDTIYQNSFFSADDLVPVLLYKRKHPNVKVIVAPRGEFYPKRIRVGAWKKYAYGAFMRITGLLRDVYFHGTGADECSYIQKFLGIPSSRIYDIQNISMCSGATQEIKKQECDLRLVYIARIHPMKNTLKAIEYLAGVTGNVTYHVYGSIEDKAYWDMCLEAIRKLPANIKVEYKGVIDHEQVPQVISEYHAYYMPTSGENFGHSIVESMLVGRPVIISDQTPWTQIGEHGSYAFPVDAKNDYRQAIQELCDMGQAEFLAKCKMAQEFIAERLDVQGTIQQYIDVFGD